MSYAHAYTMPSKAGGYPVPKGKKMPMRSVKKPLARATGYKQHSGGHSPGTPQKGYVLSGRGKQGQGY